MAEEHLNWPDFTMYGMRLVVANVRGNQLLVMMDGDNHAEELGTLGFERSQKGYWFNRHYTREDGSLKVFDLAAFRRVFPDASMSRQPLSQVFYGAKQRRPEDAETAGKAPSPSQRPRRTLLEHLNDSVSRFFSASSATPSSVRQRLAFVTHEHQDQATPLDIKLTPYGEPDKIRVMRFDENKGKFAWVVEFDVGYRMVMGGRTPDRELDNDDARRQFGYLQGLQDIGEVTDESIGKWYQDHEADLANLKRELDPNSATLIGHNVMGEKVMQTGDNRFVVPRDGNPFREGVGEEPWRFLRAGSVDRIQARSLLNCVAAMTARMRKNNETIGERDIESIARVIFDIPKDDAETKKKAIGRVIDGIEAVNAFRLNKEIRDARSMSEVFDSGLRARRGQTPDGAASLPLHVAASMRQMLGERFYNMTDCNALSPIFLALAPTTAMATLLIPGEKGGFRVSYEKREWFSAVTRDITNRYDLRPFHEGAPEATERLVGTFARSEEDLAGRSRYRVLHDQLKVSRHDHFQLAQLLPSMHDNGRAVFMIDADEGPAGEIAEESRPFFNWLHDHYHVEEVADIEEDIFRAPGATHHPRRRRMVVVHGRRQMPELQAVPERLTVVQTDDQLRRWTEKTAEAMNEADAAHQAQIKEENKQAQGEVIEQTQGLQVPYRAAAEGKSETFVPKALAPAIHKAMQRVKEDLTENKGSLNDYVAGKLEMSREQLDTVLSPEQIDAVAMGIWCLHRGRAPIIGDNTGVGKGRVLAALTLYAWNQGRPAAFITERKDLLDSFLEDLQDIGALDKALPYVMGNLHEVGLPGDKPVDTGSTARNKKNLESLKDGKNVLNSSRRVPNLYLGTARLTSIAGPNRDFLKHLVDEKQPFLILDEAHNFAGDGSNAAEFMESLTRKANDLIYSSATFSKAEYNLPIYHRALPVKVPVDELKQVVRVGGLPLQEAVAMMLAEDGVFMRRERQMENREIHNVVDSRDARNRQMGDLYAETANRLARLQEKVGGVVGNWIRQMRKAGSNPTMQRLRIAKAADIQFADPGYFSTAHHLTRQFLLSLKADELVDEIERTVADGGKPVLGLESTMRAALEQFRESLAAEKAAQDGHAVGSDEFVEAMDKYMSEPLVLDEMPHFGWAINRTANRMTSFNLREKKEVINRKTGRKKKKIRHLSLTLKDIYKSLPASDQRMVETIYREIEELKTVSERFRELPGDPISYILDRASKREVNGEPIKLMELTGRRSQLVEKNGKWIEVDKRNSVIETRDAFNEGEIHGVVINAAASSGLNLHSDARYGDTAQRNFVNGQLLGNVTKQVQLFGRVDRNNQVNPPVFKNVSSGLPAEQRMMAMFNMQLRRLAANTTGSRESVHETDAVDILNSVGDEVCRRYLVNNPAMAKYLGFSIARHPTHGDQIYGQHSQTAIKSVSNQLTARMVMFDVATQERIYQELDREYRAYVHELEVSGANPLKTRELPGDAMEVERHLMAGREGERASAFEAPLYLVRVRYREKIAAIDHDQVIQSVRFNGRRLKSDIQRLGLNDQEGLTAITKVLKAGEGELLQELRESIAGMDATRVTEQVDARRTEFKRMREVLRDLMPGGVARYTENQKVVRAVIEDITMPERSIAESLSDSDEEREGLQLRRLARANQWVVTLTSPQYGTKRVPLSLLLDDENFTPEGSAYSDVHPMASRFKKGVAQTEPRDGWVLEGNSFEAAKLAHSKGLDVEPVEYTTNDGDEYAGMLIKSHPKAALALLDAPRPAPRWDLPKAFLDIHPKIQLSTGLDNKGLSGRDLSLRRKRNSPHWEAVIVNSSKASQHWNQCHNVLKWTVEGFKQTSKSRQIAEIPDYNINEFLAAMWQEGYRFHLPAKSHHWAEEFVRQHPAQDPVDVLNNATPQTNMAATP